MTALIFGCVVEFLGGLCFDLHSVDILIRSRKYFSMESKILFLVCSLRYFSLRFKILYSAFKEILV